MSTRKKSGYPMGSRREKKDRISMPYSERGVSNSPLSKESEKLLRERLNDEHGRQEIEDFFRRNEGFAILTAKKYRDRGLPFKDVVALAFIGLLDAATRFDKNRQYKETTFALPYIKKPIRQALRRTRVVRLPDQIIYAIGKLNNIEDALEKEHGNKPSREECADKLNIPVEKIDALRRVRKNAVSLGTPIDDNDTPLSDVIPDKTVVSTRPDIEMQHQSTIDTIRKAVLELTEQERQVITWRHGLDGRPIMTLKEIGAILNISRERVRQIEMQAKLRLQDILQKQNLIQHPPQRNTEVDKKIVREVENRPEKAENPPEKEHPVPARPDSDELPDITIQWAW